MEQDVNKMKGDGVKEANSHGVFCIVTCISGAQALDADNHVPFKSSILESRLARVKTQALVVGGGGGQSSLESKSLCCSVCE
jgi:hypothetical protein